MDVPQHIAVIMDGNRRWARTRGLPILAGHRYVADRVLEPLIEHAAKRGVKYMTFWAWSTENWQRQKREVSGIMRIFRRVIEKNWQRLHKNGVRVKVIGDIAKFEPGIKQGLIDVMKETAQNKRITAVFALNYGGRDELLRAFNKLRESSQFAVRSSQIRERELERFLDTAEIPDPELIVRTGGEQRLSGFLMWQSEYSELYFASWYMPDFTPQKLDQVIEEFWQRQRRFGK